MIVGVELGELRWGRTDPLRRSARLEAAGKPVMRA